MKDERELLEEIVKYGIKWLNRLVRDTKKANFVRLMALRTAKSYESLLKPIWPNLELSKISQPGELSEAEIEIFRGMFDLSAFWTRMDSQLRCSLEAVMKGPEAE